MRNFLRGREKLRVWRGFSQEIFKQLSCQTFRFPASEVAGESQLVEPQPIMRSAGVKAL